MAVCCCSLAGTAACQHCRNNPMATDVWTNKTVTVDHIDAKPFGNGLDVCPVCGKPTTIGKPQTKADQIRNMSDEKLAEVLINLPNHLGCNDPNDGCMMDFSENELCSECVLKWLRQEVE